MVARIVKAYMNFHLSFYSSYGTAQTALPRLHRCRFEDESTLSFQLANPASEIKLQRKLDLPRRPRCHWVSEGARMRVRHSIDVTRIKFQGDGLYADAAKR